MSNNTKQSGGKRFLIMLVLLLVLLAWGLVLNVNTGSVDIPAGEVFHLVWRAVLAALQDMATGLFAFFGDAPKGQSALELVTGASAESKIIFNIRMPRMLLAAILGGALSVAGFLLQTFFRNPIAGPFVLGISSGAKMVVSFFMIFGTQYVTRVTSAMMVLAGFLGSLIVVGIILPFSQRVHNMSMLLVAGIMVGYICSAVTDFFITFAREQDIANLTSWSMGSFSGANWSNVYDSALLCLVAMSAAWLLSKPIGAYALGEDYAQSLGVNIKLFRALLILLSSLFSACVTAFAGPISFVGIAVPHITKSMLKTSQPVLVIPMSYLCGAVFCVFCDLLARTAFSPAELAIGTVTSAFGAPVVIYVLFQRRREQ